MTALAPGLEKAAALLAAGKPPLVAANQSGEKLVDVRTPAVQLRAEAIRRDVAKVAKITSAGILADLDAIRKAAIINRDYKSAATISKVLLDNIPTVEEDLQAMQAMESAAVAGQDSLSTRTHAQIMQEIEAARISSGSIPVQDHDAPNDDDY